ncbi:hypothetical protein F0L17_05325 [Streptomyces sp. TRM43335]|uniref:Uncharacterized protein n=1 Tax=Streptomyces taklimakanensis TaxID=2569853 RepID=A0A6G2B8H4_9ACTN|nr:hypothetical protein [Streptomyces taklimakanensis]MTE18560.1 hypothetical protein [Streptomyces taklimakanensis]
MTAALTAGVGLLGGCGRTDGTEGDGGGAGQPTGAGDGAIPPEVVGSWSTDGSNTFDSTVYSFYEDGVFTEETGVVRRTGRYEVGGTTLLTFPDEGDPKAFEWRIGDGGCLYLDEVRHCPYS